MHVQRFKTPSGDEMVVLSARDFDELTDARDHAHAMEDYRAHPGRWLSDAEMDAYLAAPSPLAFWRGKQGRTQAELAREVGISQPFLAQLERGKRQAAVEVYARLAKALGVPVQDVLPEGVE